MGTTSAPVFPYPGGVAGAEPPDPQAGAAGHFSWARWVKRFVKNLDAEVVKKSGDVMTGALTLFGPPTSSLHAATKQYVDESTAGLPIGTIVMFGGTAAPSAEWVMCDGSVHDSAALQAVLGSANVPDLRNKFVPAAGAAGSSYYQRGSSGGADQVQLTDQQSGLRAHTHTVDPPNTNTGAQSAQGTHSHGITVDATGTDHSHYVGLGGGDHGHNHYASNLLSAEGDFNPAGGGYVFLIGAWHTISGGGHGHAGQSNGQSNSHAHGGSAAAASTDHFHGLDIAAFNSAANTAVTLATAHENRPPFYALVYMIKRA